MNAYQMGLVVGFAVAIIGLVIFAKKNGTMKEMKGELDERQKSAQNLCFKYAYYSLMLILVAYVILDKCSLIPCFDSFSGILTCVLLSILIFVVTAIVKDAYFGFQQNKKVFYRFGAILTFVEGICAIRYLIHGSFVEEDGYLGIGYFSALVALLWIVLILTSVIHDKRSKAEEEE